MAYPPSLALIPLWAESAATAETPPTRFRAVAAFLPAMLAEIASESAGRSSRRRGGSRIGNTAQWPTATTRSIEGVTSTAESDNKAGAEFGFDVEVAQVAKWTRSPAFG
jgi:hypothetical protein